MNFAKLHGAGNDFIVLDGRDGSSLVRALPDVVPRLCHRRLGIGADGLLLLRPTGDRRLLLDYWNADGSPAVFCANGTRCAARFASQRWGWSAMVIDTPFAAIPAQVRGSAVTLELPPPSAVAPWQTVAVDGEPVRVRYVVVGVPHLVVPVTWTEFWTRPLAPLAPALRAHPELPEGGANVNFVTRHGIDLAVRSWERGVEGETLSCGSGDVAVGLVAAAEGWSDAPVRIVTASRRIVEVTPVAAAPACAARLVGPAEWVCDGTVAADLLTGTG